MDKDSQDNLTFEKLSDFKLPLTFHMPHSALVLKLLENLELRPLCLLLLVDSNKPLTVPSVVFHTFNCMWNEWTMLPIHTMIVPCLTSSLVHVIAWSSHLGEESLFATHSLRPIILPQEGGQSLTCEITWSSCLGEENLFAIYSHPLMILPQEGEQQCEEVIGTRWLATSTTYPKRHELIDQPKRTAIEALPSIMCKGISQERDEPLEDMLQVKNCAKLLVVGRVFLQELKGKILAVWNFRAVELHRIVKKEQNRWIAQGLQK
ncbi:uncharacterized protein BJ212DRAFT_1509415 [Suillus subaureus]|uniref:Uncharacterized protein n=1 Tax=Suillus subaureus TaxID=48587 RepID=A0A9P7JJE9_9AGAM|nr:uncharacterized protein BJ212DRAFT_1509415 [Suillus subaureus]KAG1825658.1 hypothetical protein BJ212DRAFT_1509415 [Suillus subaureus]